MPRSSPSSSLASKTQTYPNPTAYAFSFFLFGCLNNVLYVVILSAALDLVDKASTPKVSLGPSLAALLVELTLLGLILFANIAPALLVKLGWPYFVPGEPRYRKRVIACSAVSFAGILIVALSTSLLPRLLGISLASFSSGLGEMTYLQLSTIYGSLSHPSFSTDPGGVAVGWFASGTGAAGLVGAGLWWVLRGLGFLPLCMSLTYFFLLPPLASFHPTSLLSSTSSAAPYSALPTLDSSENDSEGVCEDDSLMRQVERNLEKLPWLTTREKIALARPLVGRFMLPLFFVYLAEYTINSGVAPTLVYEVPDPKVSPVLASMIKGFRDYYPLWQLLYQTFVFISRSSLSILRLPPLPLALLPLPTLLQLLILLLTTLEASTSFFVNALGEAGATWVTVGLVCAEGLCGGAAYVNCFYRLGMENGELEEEESEGLLDRARAKKDPRRREQEKEFVRFLLPHSLLSLREPPARARSQTDRDNGYEQRIASVGFADTLGILVASLVASALEPRLCSAQVAHGRTYCREL
ncbi:SPOSA6832_00612, partial [Sporobolomyces salmonicolor]